MKNVCYIILLFLFVAGCGKIAGNDKTPPVEKEQQKKKFFNQDGQFRINFEGDPTSYAQDVPYENGKVRMHYFIYEKGINLIYCISYADYPESFMKGKVAADLLGDMLVLFVDSKKAGLETQKQINVNTWPGIYFKASNSDTFIYGEYILKNNRLYQLSVTKEGSYHNEADVNAFFNSLEIL